VIAWRMLSDFQVYSAGEALFLDEALLNHVRRPTLRVWQNHPCLVLGRSDARLPRLEHALDVLLSEGVEALQRRSGGTAVWHGPGVLNVSVIVPAAYAPQGVHEGFEQLGQGMLDGLRALNIDAQFGNMPNTFCDGPHNIVATNKKIAGLAQRRRRSGVLVHAVVLVDLDLNVMHNTIERFYALAGRPVQYARDKVTTVSQLTQTTTGVDAVRDAIFKAYAKSTQIALDAVSPKELREAGELASTFRLRA